MKAEKICDSKARILGRFVETKDARSEIYGANVRYSPRWFPIHHESQGISFCSECWD